MVRANRRDGFGFGEVIVHVGSIGDQVSFYTTVDVVGYCWNSEVNTNFPNAINLYNVGMKLKGQIRMLKKSLFKKILSI